MHSVAQFADVIDNGSNLPIFSAYTLNAKEKWPDFDSAVPDFFGAPANVSCLKSTSPITTAVATSFEVGFA